MRLAYVLIGVILLGEAPLLGRRRPESRGGDRGSYWALLLLTAAGYWFAFSYAAHARPTFGPWAAWLGTFLVVGGTAFRQWAIRTLGRFFTVRVRVSSDQPVVQDGPYRWVRHPSYTGAIAAAAGVGLALGNVVSFCCVLLSLLLSFAYRISVEERALRETLGEPYRAYCARTKRLIPFIW